RRALKVCPEVHEQHPIASMAFGKEPQRKRGGGKHGAVHSPLPLARKSGVLAAQPEQVDVQRVHLGMRQALGKIELAAVERRGIARIIEARALLEIEDAGKLGQKLAASLAHGGAQLRIEVGK